MYYIIYVYVYKLYFILLLTLIKCFKGVLKDLISLSGYNASHTNYIKMWMVLNIDPTIHKKTAVPVRRKAVAIRKKTFAGA